MTVAQWASITVVGAVFILLALVLGYRRGYDAGHRRGWIMGMGRAMQLWASEEQRKPSAPHWSDHPAVAQTMTNWHPPQKH